MTSASVGVLTSRDGQYQARIVAFAGEPRYMLAHLARIITRDGYKGALQLAGLEPVKEDRRARAWELVNPDLPAPEQVPHTVAADAMFDELPVARRDIAWRDWHQVMGVTSAQREAAAERVVPGLGGAVFNAGELLSGSVRDDPDEQRAQVPWVYLVEPSGHLSIYHVLHEATRTRWNLVRRFPYEQLRRLTGKILNRPV